MTLHPSRRRHKTYILHARWQKQVHSVLMDCKAWRQLLGRDGLEDLVKVRICMTWHMTPKRLFLPWNIPFHLCGSMTWVVVALLSCLSLVHRNVGQWRIVCRKREGSNSWWQNVFYRYVCRKNNIHVINILSNGIVIHVYSDNNDSLHWCRFGKSMRNFEINVCVTFKV